MQNEIQRSVVLGAGSAGLLSALTLKRAFPRQHVSIIHSPEIPIIGVGESTTVLFPPFLHKSLGFDVQEFFHEVRPSWKLGVRFEWGDPNDSHFNYPFDSCMSHKPARLPRNVPYYCLHDWHDASRCWALMDQGLSPCFRDANGSLGVNDAYGYHLENRAFVAYLKKKAISAHIEFIEGKFAHADLDDDGFVTALRLSNDRKVDGDLFVDCSGFSSQLLGRTLNDPFQSYEQSLFCDRAVIGSTTQFDAIQPYTTARTMKHGWCWRIDFADHITRGYVYSSAFCSDETAASELKETFPELSDDLRVVKFRSGRYENFWRANVVAIGNACGFVEPLEATALHLVVEQLRLLCRMLLETDQRVSIELQRLGNTRFRLLWDEVRDFLAVHYKFNRRVDSEFWRHCQSETDLAGASELIEVFQNVGPSTLATSVLPGGHIFGYDGFMAMLIGQRVPTSFEPQFSPDELQLWDSYRQHLRQGTKSALPMDTALRHLYS